ncbi:MAG: hypothetical protein WBQ23_08855 [Bacteroidota bacterium]
MRMTTFLILLSLLTPFIAFGQGWEWQNPKPHGQTINDMVMVDAVHGVAVCNNGFYMYTADAGHSWATYRLGHSNLERITVAQDGSLILVSDKRRIYRSTDMAYSWQLVYSASVDARVPGFDITTTPGGTLLAMLNGAYFVKSSDNGATWNQFADNKLQITFDNPVSISVQSNSVWMIITNRNVFRTTDGGDSWDFYNDDLDVQGLRRLVFIDSLYGYQLREGQLLRTHDGGVNWDEMDIFGFGSVMDLQVGPRLGSSVFCMSIGRYLLNASTDAGESWNISLTETAFADSYPSAIEFVDAQTGFVAGDGGRILRTEDGGQSWSIVHGIGYIGTITDLIFADGSNGIATTYSPTVLLTTDGGRRWNEAIPSADHDCDELAASPSGTLFIVATTSGYDFDLLRSTDKGVSWTLLSRLPIQYSSTNPEMAQSILAISDQEIWVGATFGILLRSYDGGVTWDRSFVQQGISNPYSTGTDIFYFPPSTVIYMQSNGLNISTDMGGSWETRLTPRARTIWEPQFLTPDIGFGLISGEFSRTTDGGMNWETMDGFSPQLINFFDENNGLALWSDSQQDDLTFVMQTSDAGRSWEKFSMGERAGYNGWFFLSPTRMWGFGYGGAIRYNGDGGIVDAGRVPFSPSGLTVDPGFPNPFSSAANDAYRIPFTSSDGGALHLTLQDLLGRYVATIDRAATADGKQSIAIPAAALRGLSPGTFLYRLTVGSQSSTGRLILR